MPRLQAGWVFKGGRDARKAQRVLHQPGGQRALEPVGRNAAIGRRVPGRLHERRMRLHAPGVELHVHNLSESAAIAVPARAADAAGARVAAKATRHHRHQQPVAGAGRRDGHVPQHGQRGHPAPRHDQGRVRSVRQRSRIAVQLPWYGHGQRPRWVFCHPRQPRRCAVQRRHDRRGGRLWPRAGPRVPLQTSRGGHGRSRVRFVLHAPVSRRAHGRRAAAAAPFPGEWTGRHGQTVLAERTHALGGELLLPCGTHGHVFVE